MDGGGGRFTVMLKACVADCGPAVLESVAFTLKFDVPFGPVGVPEITPALLIVRPAGRLPITVRLSAPAPPVATTVRL
jgi:hypothetical protein